jgi:hypothetical protein
MADISERKHPEYEELIDHWNFLESTYDGGRDWFDSNIFKYFKEGTNEYSDRIGRAYRFNHTREVVDIVTKYLFKSHIVRNEEDASQEVIDFWRRPSRVQPPGGMDQFMRNVATRASIFGRIYIVIDSTFVGSAASKAEEKLSGGQVYAYAVPPQRAKDMAFDEFGQLRWIIIEEDWRDDEDPIESTGEIYTRYRLWTKEDWVLYGQEEGGKGGFQQIDSGTHNLGMVPVIPFDHIVADESQYSSPSMVGDVAYLDRANANYLSNLDAIIQDQTFSQLVIPAQSLPVTTEGKIEEQHQTLIELGTKRIFTYDAAEGARPPEYISPDVKQAQLIVTVVKQIINEIYHSVGVAGERTKQDNAMGIDNSSGVAKAYDFERVNSLLTSKGASLEALENRIVEIVERYSGKDDFESDLVVYPDNFDTRGLKDEFEIAMNLSMIGAPDDMRRYQMESLVDKLFPHLKKSLKEELKRNLENWPEDSIQVSGGFGASLESEDRQGQVTEETNLDKAEEDGTNS